MNSPATEIEALKAEVARLRAERDAAYRNGIEDAAKVAITEKLRRAYAALQCPEDSPSRDRCHARANTAEAIAHDILALTALNGEVDDD